MLGYPGAGKTTAAKIISQLTGAVHLWADKERRERYGTPTHNHAENLDLYHNLNNTTDRLLADGKSVIFDTNFNFYKDREHLRAIAAKHSALTHLVWVTTPKVIAKERATLQSHGQDTRLFGNMPVKDFERMSGNLEPPKPDEATITIDGTSITTTSIQDALSSAST